MPEQLPPSKHPLAAVHPWAYRACVFCRRSMRIFFCGMGIGIVGAFAFRSAWSFVPLRVSLVVMFCCALGGLFSFLARFLLVALFFTRYSLAQLLGVVLCFGACGTGIVALPQWWKPIPVMTLVCLVIAVFFYVVAQDPEGPVYTPAFLSLALERKKKQAEDGNTESGR